MSDPVIVSALRTPIGTSFKGTLRTTEAADLAMTVIGGLLETERARETVEDVVLAESLYGGGVIARFAAHASGLDHVPGLAVNRHCAGGLSAVLAAAGAVRSGDQAVLAGGVQSSSTAPIPMSRHDPSVPWLFESHRPSAVAPADDMSVTVGWNAARLSGVSREDQDDWALRSHTRAVAAIDAGQFVDEIVPVQMREGDGTVVEFAVDEHPRRTTSAEKLAGLAPLHPEIPGFSVTAGNASGINDAAAAVLMADPGVASANGWEPMCRVHAGVSVGVSPERTGLAVVTAIEKLLARTGLSVSDIDLWEINEAFASVPIAAVRALGLPDQQVNPFGSGCSLGHPVAATGGRMVVTLAHELRRRGAGRAVAAMCAGGGMATAVLLERGASD
jgi:acetyl-CoA acetyltransferase family protein